MMKRRPTVKPVDGIIRKDVDKDTLDEFAALIAATMPGAGIMEAVQRKNSLINNARAELDAARSSQSGFDAVEDDNFARLEPEEKSSGRRLARKKAALVYGKIMDAEFGGVDTSDMWPQQRTRFEERKRVRSEELRKRLGIRFRDRFQGIFKPVRPAEKAENTLAPDLVVT